MASRGFDAIGIGYTAPLSHWSRTVRVRAPTGLSLVEGTPHLCTKGADQKGQAVLAPLMAAWRSCRCPARRSCRRVSIWGLIDLLGCFVPG